MRNQMHQHSKQFYPVNYLKSQVQEISTKKDSNPPKSFLSMPNFPEYQNNLFAWMSKISSPFTFKVKFDTSGSSSFSGLQGHFMGSVRRVMLKMLIGILRFGYRICKKVRRFQEWFYRFMDSFVMMDLDGLQVLPKAVQQKPLVNSATVQRDFLSESVLRTNGFKEVIPNVRQNAL